MNFNSCLLLSHVFIRDTETYKIEIVDFVINHFRIHNPDTYIIITGHGIRPQNLHLVDYYYWSDQIIESEINLGHPFLVNKGIDHAISKGFKKMCKTRADGVHLISNLINFCESKLKNKNLLITQQTKFSKPEMGDLFLYGDLLFLKKCWNIDTWYPTDTGLKSLANNFIQACPEHSWISKLKSNCEFIDIYNLKWIDFRANFDLFKLKKIQILNNDLDDFYNFLWGTQENWHRFDRDGSLVGRNKLDLITENTWKNI
jgi:hypothetical protein